jgi:hypothetical protein
LRQWHADLEAARTESRNQVAAEMLAVLKPVFADMRARVPGYADWYFGYVTKYELMAYALVPAIDHLGRKLDFFSEQNPRQRESVVQSMSAYLTTVLDQQYAREGVQPHQAEVLLQAAFDNSYGKVRARWAGIIAEQRGAMRAFIRAQGGSAETLSADQAAGLHLDWDGTRSDASAMHAENVIFLSFRGGLLSVRMTIPKSARAHAESELGDNAVEKVGDVNHVIMDVFDRVVGSTVSQIGDLAAGILAGSVASGLIEWEMAGGVGPAAGAGTVGAPAVAAASLATAVPIGAAIGLAATVVAEILSNRMEEALDRTEFEENIRQTVDAMETSVETKMISVLDEHVEASYVDIAYPVAVK